jgi:hypothetical protein
MGHFITEHKLTKNVTRFVKIKWTPVLTHMTLLWNKDVCENKVELVRRTNETYFNKQQLTQAFRVIRNPVILRLISL